MTHIIYLRTEAERAESKTATNNKPICPVYEKQKESRHKRSECYCLITHMIERETVNPSAIKFALSRYEPINQLEYE